MGEREVLDRLGSIVPGYRGYIDRELRRSTDRVLRDTIVSRLGVTRRRIVEAIGASARSMRFDDMEGLEAYRRRVETIVDQVRHAPEGYSGFFDAVRVDAKQLEAVHAHDAAMCDRVEAVESAVAGLERDESAGLEAALRDLEEAVRERRERLLGVAGVSDHA